MQSGCEDNDRALSLLADGWLDPETAVALEAHLQACERCREELRWLRQLQATAAALPLEEASPRLWSRIEKQLDADAARRPRRFSRVLALAAALALCVLSVELFRQPRHSPELADPNSPRLRGPDAASDGIARLVQMLRDPDADVRASAAEGLSLAGPAAKLAIPDLERLKDDPDPFVRQEAARAIEKLRALP